MNVRELEAFSLVFIAVPTFVFMICSLRTNVVYVFLFATIMTGFCLLAGCYWQLAQLNIEMADHLQVVSFSFLPLVLTE